MSEHNDALADAVALVETMRAGDVEGVSAVVANMAAYEVALTLAIQWVALLDEMQVPMAKYRLWAQDAEGRQPPILVCALADACRVPGALARAVASGFLVRLDDTAGGLTSAWVVRDLGAAATLAALSPEYEAALPCPGEVNDRLETDDGEATS